MALTKTQQMLIYALHFSGADTEMIKTIFRLLGASEQHMNDLMLWLSELNPELEPLPSERLGEISHKAKEIAGFGQSFIPL